MHRVWDLEAGLLGAASAKPSVARSSMLEGERVVIYFLGRALGQFMFALIGLKRILFTNIVSEALKAPPSF